MGEFNTQRSDYADAEQAKKRINAYLREYRFSSPLEASEVFSKLGVENGLAFLTDWVRAKINTPEVRYQFILEELDAARAGNEHAKRFVSQTGIPESEYLGSLDRSWEEVDGPSGPQQTLLRLLLPMRNNVDNMVATRVRIVQAIHIDHLGKHSKFPQLSPIHEAKS